MFVRNKKVSRKLWVSLTIIIIVLSVLGFGGYYTYTNTYLPHQASSYVESVNSELEAVEISVESLAEDVPIAFYFDKNSKDTEFLREDSQLTNSKELAENLSSLADESKNSTPEANRLTRNLDAEISLYYTSIEGIAEDYVKLMQYEENLKPYIIEINKIEEQYQLLYSYDTTEELDEMIAQCEEWESDYTDLKKDVESIQTDDYTDTKQQYVLSYIQEIILFMQENVEITERFIEADSNGDDYAITLETYNYAKLEVNYEDAKDAFQKGLRDYDGQIRNSLLDRIEEIQTTKESIDEGCNGFSD